MLRKNNIRARSAAVVAALGVLAAAVILLAGVWSRSVRNNSGRLKTNEDRVEYLAALGWEVTPTPLSEQLILLPEQFPDVLREYNSLQTQQGFDLEKYAGKEAVLYTYEVLNYPSDEAVRCCLYVYKNRVIGGDIHSTSYTGFMMGIR